MLLKYSVLTKVTIVCGQRSLLFCPKEGGADCSMLKKSNQKKTFICIVLAAIFTLGNVAGSIHVSAAAFEPPTDLTDESSGSTLPASRNTGID